MDQENQKLYTKDETNKKKTQIKNAFFWFFWHTDKKFEALILFKF